MYVYDRWDVRSWEVYVYDRLDDRNWEVNLCDRWDARNWKSYVYNRCQECLYYMIKCAFMIYMGFKELESVFL